MQGVGSHLDLPRNDGILLGLALALADGANKRVEFPGPCLHFLGSGHHRCRKLLRGRGSGSAPALRLEVRHSCCVCRPLSYARYPSCNNQSSAIQCTKCYLAIPQGDGRQARDPRRRGVHACCSMTSISQHRNCRQYFANSQMLTPSYLLEAGTCPHCHGSSFAPFRPASHRTVQRRRRRAGKP